MISILFPQIDVEKLMGLFCGNNYLTMADLERGLSMITSRDGSRIAPHVGQLRPVKYTNYSFYKIRDVNDQSCWQMQKLLRTRRGLRSIHVFTCTRYELLVRRN